MQLGDHGEDLIYRGVGAMIERHRYGCMDRRRPSPQGSQDRRDRIGQKSALLPLIARLVWLCPLNGRSRTDTIYRF
jgi:hypothetical protein